MVVKIHWCVGIWGLYLFQLFPWRSLRALAALIHIFIFHKVEHSFSNTHLLSVDSVFLPPSLILTVLDFQIDIQHTCTHAYTHTLVKSISMAVPWVTVHGPLA